METGRPFWWDLPLARSASVAPLVVGDQAALFCARTQRLSAINETAWRIWTALGEGLSCAMAARGLRELGAGGEDADAHVRGAAVEWLRAGYLVPREVLAGRRAAPIAVQAHRAAGLSFKLCYFGDGDPDAGRSVFAGLPEPDGDPDVCIDIVGRGGVNFLVRGDCSLGMCAPAQTAPALKAQITEDCSRAVAGGFLVHGAVVSAHGVRMLLMGAPGAGKTTLTLALVGSGFVYGGDDIAYMTADGAIRGVPFAAAAKEGAWPLLRDHVPSLLDLPVCERADGKLTRYVLPELADAAGGPLDVVLLLARERGAAAYLESIPPLEALCSLLESSFSPRGGLESETMQAVARSVSMSACHRLIYEDLGDAVVVVKGLAHAMAHK